MANYIDLQELAANHIALPELVANYIDLQEFVANYIALQELMANFRSNELSLSGFAASIGHSKKNPFRCAEFACKPQMWKADNKRSSGEMTAIELISGTIGQYREIS